MLKLIFNFSFLFFASVGFGSEADVKQSRALENYKNEIAQRQDLQILIKLRDLGIDDIGGKPIDQVIERAARSKIEIAPSDNVHYLNADGSERKSGRWQEDITGTKEISLAVDQARKALGEETRQGLLLHETLGGADRNFATSSLIHQALKANQLQKLPADSIKRSFLLSAGGDGGGTTGVGGGGDYRIQYYLDLIYLKMFQHQFSAKQITDVNCFLAKNFDFDIDPAVPQGQIKTTDQPDPKTHHIKIYFAEPKSLGTHDEEAYMRDYDINVPLIKSLVELFIKNSEGSCTIP